MKKMSDIHGINKIFYKSPQKKIVDEWSGLRRGNSIGPPLLMQRLGIVMFRAFRTS
jgi:hypothetical protein